MPNPKKKTASKLSPVADERDAEEVIDVDESLEVLPVTYTITAYGADYPVDGVVKRMKSEDIVVPTFRREPDKGSKIVGFQREYVWGRPKADRFIESLLLGLPVPGIFLVTEPSGRLLVLDGHQRLYTLRAFCEGIIDREEYRLDNVQKRFLGVRYKDLDIEDRRRLDNSIIHATIIRQDKPSKDQSSIYTIFERLNTGGVNLQPQEIRVALYHGPIVRVLRKLNDNPDWRTLFGNRSKRLKDMEMILRFFAFYFGSEKYESPMKDFLNKYMARNRQLAQQSEDELTKIFENTVAVIAKAIGHRAFRPERAVNAAVIDSVMTGVARRLAAGPIKAKEQLVQAYRKLLRNKLYRDAVETGTSQEAKVKMRIKKATKAFSLAK